MIGSRIWKRLTRQGAVGLCFGAATALGFGCRSAEPLPEPPGQQITFIPLGFSAQPRKFVGDTATAGGPVTVSSEITAGSPSAVRPAIALEAVEPTAPRSAEQTEPSTTQIAAGAEETIDLGIALRLAGVGNPTINLARELVREALAGQLAARSLLLPSINIGGNYHHHNGILESSPGFIQQVNSQSLYLGLGARTLAGESVAFPGIRLFAHLGDAVYEPLVARQVVSARRSDALAVQNAILLDVATAYLQLIGAETRLVILRQGESELGEILRITQAYAKTGQGRPADEKRTETHADLLEREIRQAEEEAAVASARLCRLLNLDTSVRLRSPGGPVEQFRMITEDADIEALVAIAIQSRPEVFARAAEIRETQTRVRQERVRPWLPLVSVGYSGGYFGGGSNLVTPDFAPLKGRSDFDVLAVWTAQNLGFGNRARVRQTEAVFREAMAGYDIAVNQIRREVAEASAATRAAGRQIALAKNSVDTAEEGFRLEADRIRGGFGRPLEALDTFQQLIDARQELLRAVVAFDIEQFRLFVAVGSNPLAGSPAISPVPIPVMLP